MQNNFDMIGDQINDLVQDSEINHINVNLHNNLRANRTDELNFNSECVNVSEIIIQEITESKKSKRDNRLNSFRNNSLITYDDMKFKVENFTLLPKENLKSIKELILKKNCNKRN